MRTMIKSHFEKLLLFLAGGALLLSGGWCWRRQSAMPPPLFLADPIAENYRPSGAVVDSTVVQWSSPVAQAAGPEWVFEVFSPPLIQRNADTKEFVAGLLQLRKEESTEAGIKVLAIRAAPYRVQLQGGFALADGYMAALVAVEAHEVWCGRPGERWPAMQVVLEKMDIASEAMARAGSDPDAGRFAQATLRDEKSGRQVVLIAGVPAMTRELRATVRLAGSAGTRNLREGDVCDDGDVAYRVDRLSVDPIAVAVITKMESDDDAGEILLLRPAESDVADPGKGARAELSPDPHLFHNGP